MKKGKKLSLEIQKKIVNLLEELQRENVKIFSIGKIKSMYEKKYNKKISYLTVSRHLNSLARIGKLKAIEVTSAIGKTNVYQFI